jgi:hypothetical protein
MFQVGLVGSGCDGKVCSSDKDEKHDESEECEGEEKIDAEGTD